MQQDKALYKLAGVYKNSFGLRKLKIERIKPRITICFNAEDISILTEYLSKKDIQTIKASSEDTDIQYYI